MIVTVKSSDRVLVDEDVYSAKVRKIQAEKKKSGEVMLCWYFEIIGGEFDGVEVRGITDTEPSAKNRFGEWLIKLGVPRDDLIEGVQIDTDDYIGKFIRINVEHSKDGQYSNVKALLKMKPEDKDAAKAALAKRKKKNDDDEDEAPKKKGKKPLMIIRR